MRQMFEYVRLNRRYPSIWANVWMRRNRCIHDSFALPMMHTWFVEGEWHIRQRVSSTQNRDKWTWAQISNPLQAMLDEQLQLSHSRIQGILDTSSRVIAWFETISRRMSVALGRILGCILIYALRMQRCKAIDLALMWWCSWDKPLMPFSKSESTHVLCAP